jgi:uncharacterized iron-regulated membrane protein
MRVLILIHRYLGIFISIVVLLWCLSGVVMMYVQYPEYTRPEQLAHLELLDLDSCCDLPGDWPEDFSFTYAEIESFLGNPVLRLASGREIWSIDLSSGKLIGQIDALVARSVAERLARGQAVYKGQKQRDQWTVAGDYDVHRPLHHFALQDDADTEWYVSGTTGQLVLRTTARERFWNRLGAVVHWLYPTQLRRHVLAWSQTVIWLSIAGTFLTLAGLYVGVARYCKGRGSLYRGWLLWHHYAGLVFGLFTLTWMVSGLLSMTPFGALSGREFSVEHENLRGGEQNYGHVVSSLANLDRNLVAPDTVRLTSSMFAGEFAWIAWSKGAVATRVGAALPVDRLKTQATRVRPQIHIRSLGLIDQPDAYYYSHHDIRTFPVLRIVYEDGERFYLDTISGELLGAMDSSRRWARWLFHGLHRGDFAAWARRRPLWDLIMLFLLAGVTLGATTGTFLAGKRMARRARPKY